MHTTPLFVGDDDGLRDYANKDQRLSLAKRRDPTFGLALRERRSALGLSQIELAKAIGIHQITLCRLETATVPLTSKMRKRIEEALLRLEGDA